MRARVLYRASTRTFAGQLSELYGRNVYSVFTKLASRLNQRKGRDRQHHYHLFAREER